MKKLLFALIVCGLLLSGCGNISTLETQNSDVSVSESKMDNASSSSSKGVEDSSPGFKYKIEECDTNGNDITYTIWVYNNSDKIADGVIQFTFEDKETGQVYNQPVILDHVKPNNTDFGLFRLPIGVYDGNQDDVPISIVRINLSDSIEMTPELSSEELYSYIIPIYEISSTNRDRQYINADVYNTTTKYFTGTITVDVLDEDGNVLDTKTKYFQNVEPGFYDFITLDPQISKTYQYRMCIGDDFQLTRTPISE